MATDDLIVHQEMWHNFTRLMGYSATAILALLAAMALFLL
ncbi:MAG: aa3-type cytochrome c oxidase subunit IV [Gemmatimonas sp.]